MGKTSTISIDKDLYDDISEYCKFNNISIKEFAEKVLENALMIEKYGETPFANYQSMVDLGESGNDKTAVNVYDKDNKLIKTFVTESISVETVKDMVNKIDEEEKPKVEEVKQEKPEEEEIISEKPKQLRPKRRLK